MDGEVSLAMLVTDWLIEKKFPVRTYQSVHDGIVWIDLDLKKPLYPKFIHCALLAIVDTKADPYVTLLDDRARPQEFYNPAHPEFFGQIENGIIKTIKTYLKDWDGRT